MRAQTLGVLHSRNVWDQESITLNNPQQSCRKKRTQCRNIQWHSPEGEGVKCQKRSFGGWWYTRPLPPALRHPTPGPRDKVLHHTHIIEGDTASACSAKHLNKSFLPLIYPLYRIIAHRWSPNAPSGLLKMRKQRRSAREKNKVPYSANHAETLQLLSLLLPRELPRKY